MVGDVLRLGLAVFSVSTHLNRVEKIPMVVVVNSANSRFHCSREWLHDFRVNFYDFE